MMDRIAIRPPILVLFLTITLLACVHCEINEKSARQIVDEPTKIMDESMKKNCTKSYSVMCLKLDVVSFVDKLAAQKNIGLLPGVSVVKETGADDVPVGDMAANLAREFPNDVDKRLDVYLLHKIGSYLNSHSISIKLFDPKTFEAARSFNENTLSQLGWFGSSTAESARKKQNNMGALAAGLMMMKGTLGALGFGALAMLAGKALMTGLMALMLSAIVGLKSLASGGEKKTTYEIVSKPVYSTSHSHSSEEIHHGHGYGHSGYGRSLDIVEANVQEGIRKYGNVRDRRAV